MARSLGKGENLIAGKVLTLESAPPTIPANASPPANAAPAPPRPPTDLTHVPPPPSGSPTATAGRSGSRGIRDLLVVCYDVDPVVKTPTTPVTPVAPVAPAPGAAAEGIVLQQAVGPSFWAKFPGQRLGSTLTDANGNWELVYQDDLQSDAEPDERIQRPDLAIFVLAPEDTYTQLGPPVGLEELRGLWVPDLVRARVLHFSREVRLNAGRIENYVIRIREELLAQAGLSDWIERADDSAEELDRSVDDFFRRRDHLVDTFRGRRRERLAAVKSIRDTIRGDGRIAPDFLKDRGFVSGGRLYIAASAREPATITARVTDAYAAARASVPSTETSQRRRFRFRLTESEVDGVVRRTPDGDAVLVNWLIDRYCEATRSDNLFAAASPLARCLQRHDVQAAIDEVMAAETTDTSPSALPPPPPAYDLNTQIEQLMNRLAAPAYSADELKAERLDPASLEGRLNAVDLQPGPADVTAYHYFQHLELALPHVWSELFDEDVIRRGEDLYTELVRTQQQELGEAVGYDARVESIEDLRKLMQAAQDVADATGGAASDGGSPEFVREQLPEITDATWRVLDAGARGQIELWAALAHYAEDSARHATATRQSLLDGAEDLRRRARTLVETKLAEATRSAQETHLGRLLSELAERLAGNYKFTIFAPETVNFGLLVTYRQAWRPINYQVGRLVKTIPLAPGESREYSIKRAEKKSRNEKEVENNLRIKKTDAEDKGTVESQILNKVANKTNWKLSAEASGSVGAFSASASAGMDGSAERASDDSKKSMREAVHKANEEDKKEHTWEVTKSEETQVETTETVKISNPNQEIPVTYLLYELQRRFGIAEKLHSVQPVVLVANEVPPPHQVNEDFLVAYDWIIRRALLDDAFRPALAYLAEGFAGDELRLEVLRHAKEKREVALNILQDRLEPYETMLANAGEALQTQISRLSRAVRDDDDELVAARRIREEAARETVLRLTQERADLKGLIDRASADLAEAEKALAEALQTNANMQTEILRLRNHVAQNILHYMQAIWETEHPDQRYFRLYNVKVPKIPFPPPDATETRRLGRRRDPLTLEWVCDTTLPAPGFPLPPDSEWPTLGEVADLDNLLGYKGNYMIFPLKNASDRQRSNYLTAFMAQSYVSDSGAGAGDPDPAGDATLPELVDYFRCLKHERETAGGHLSDEALAEMRRLIALRVADPYKDEQEMIVRTDSLFIEALPGTHPVLEGYKLRHRVLDVQKVAAEVRGAELENLRLVERLRAGDREDPHVDKRVEIKGATVLSVTEPEGPPG